MNPKFLAKRCLITLATMIIVAIVATAAEPTALGKPAASRDQAGAPSGCSKGRSSFIEPSRLIR
jgi:hypothetical protein